MKKVLFAIVLSMCIVWPCMAQFGDSEYLRGATYLEDVLPASPEPAAAVKYADVPFTHSLGLAELDIPLYTLSGRELSLPIGLHYRSGGIKLDEIGGVAGLGWTLEAGGCITRSVVYMPDEFSSGTFTHQTPAGTLLTYLQNQTENNSAMNYLRNNVWHNVDSSLDRYSYNICGLRGSFLILDDDSVVQLNGDGVLISFTRNSGSGAVDSFTVTGPDGTVYILSEKEIGSNSVQIGNMTPMSGQPGIWTAPTAWHLTSVTSPSGLETANFTYASGGTWERKVQSIAKTTTIEKTASTQQVSTGVDASYVSTTYQTKVLSAITLGLYTASFSYQSGTGSDYHQPMGVWTQRQNFPSRLTNIKVRCSGAQMLNVEVGTGNATNDGRIVLNYLRLTHRNEVDDRWDFTYKTKNASVSRYSQDWYGYYNAETGRNNLCPFSQDSSFGTFTLSYGTPDSTEADYMSLLSADHDGALTTFAYEGSAGPYANQPYYIGVRVKSITVKDNGTTTMRKREFSYADPSFDGPWAVSIDAYSSLSAQQGTSGSGMGTTSKITWAFSVQETPSSIGMNIMDTKVVYGSVTEEITDGTALHGAKTVYSFMKTDTLPIENQTIGRFPSYWGSTYSGNLAPANPSPMDHIQQSYREEAPKGPAFLTQKDSYAWNGSSYEHVQRESYTYEDVSRNQYLVDYHAQQVMIRSTFGEVGNLQYQDIYHYPVWVHDYPGRNPKTVTTIGYHASGIDSSTVSYNYSSIDNLSVPSRVSYKKIIEGNVERSITYTYPDKWIGAPAWANALASAHRLSLPVEVSTYYLDYDDVVFPPVNPHHNVSSTEINSIGDGGLNPNPTPLAMEWKNITTEYGAYTINGQTRYLPTCRIEKTNNVESWRETILSRDNYGNVTSYKEKGRPSTVLLWSGVVQHPVAVIENATFEDVAYTIGYNYQSFINTLAQASILSGPQLATLNALRGTLPAAHVSTYTFLPGIGISSVTDPAGVVTNYSYDAAGRLEYIKDADGHKMEGYAYDLYNNGGSGRKSIRHFTYRTDTGNSYSEDVRWFNTMGLALEDISIQGAGGGKSLVSAYESDFMLHDDVKSWLPYPVTDNSGAFQTNAPAYAASYHGNAKAYNHKGYEISSRDKVLTTAAPGYDGVHVSTSSEEVVSSFPKVVWRFAGIPSLTPNYNQHEVIEERTVDADGRRRSTYKDHIGRILGTAWGAASPTSGDPAPTYYVYDKHDRLRAVIGSGISFSDSLNMWRYGYDNLDRLSSKGIPGLEREFYTYDSEDRIVSITRGNISRTIEYDQMNRVTNVYYSVGSSSTPTLIEEHYYDTYPSVAGSLLSMAHSGTWTGPKKGLETFSRIAEFDGNGDIVGTFSSVYLYDAKKRLVTLLTHDPSGGYYKEVTTYTFSGDVASVTSSYNHGSAQEILTRSNSYDIRGRLTQSTASLSVGGSIVVSETTQYTYDALGRPSGTSTTSATGGINGVTIDSEDTYTIQNWLASHSVKRNTVTLFSESLNYDGSNMVSGASPLYTGMIAEKTELWNPSGTGNGASIFSEGYQYDNASRVTFANSSVSGGTSFTYDARGNILSAGSETYTYSGNRMLTHTRSGIGSRSFTHDGYGRMTYDGDNELTIAYNFMDLPRKISGTGGVLVNYSYLASGNKTGAENGSGAGLVYRGSLIYRKAADGTLTLESAAVPEGRLTANGFRYHVTDRLGSVRAVVDGATGNLYSANDFDVYGKNSTNASAAPYLSTAPSGETFRDGFTGKEDQGPDFGTAYTDFGARQYSPALRRWLVPDPLSEKYYDVSPYAYCAGNPVNLVDKDGRKIVFVHGLPKFGARSGRAYWGEGFVRKAMSVLNDKNSDIAEYNYSILSSSSSRRGKGYYYAMDNYERLLSNMKEGETFKFVSHSMGAAFSEGMADYLREKGHIVDIMIHLSPFQASDIHSSGVNENILTIDFQTEGDPVLMLGLLSQGSIQGADNVIRKESRHPFKEIQYRHTETLSISTWDEIVDIINAFLHSKQQDE